MFRTLKKFFAFCGEDNRRLFIASIWLGVISAICSAMRIPAAAIVIRALLEKNVTAATLWTSLGIIVLSLVVTIAINMKSTMLQTRAGYRACARDGKITPSKRGDRNVRFHPHLLLRPRH